MFQNIMEEKNPNNFFTIYYKIYPLYFTLYYIQLLQLHAISPS
jgi:hypothetical protein